MRHNTMSLSIERRPIAAFSEQPGFTLHRLPIPPSLNNLFVNAKQGKGRFPSDRYKTWRHAAGWVVLQQKPRRVRGPVTIWLMFEDGGTRADIDNLTKPCLDLLVTHQLIDEDGPHVVRKVVLEWGKVEGCQIKVEPARAV